MANNENRIERGVRAPSFFQGNSICFSSNQGLTDATFSRQLLRCEFWTQSTAAILKIKAVSLQILHFFKFYDVSHHEIRLELEMLMFIVRIIYSNIFL